jgi:S1-C subfamily serine protease
MLTCFVPIHQAMVAVYFRIILILFAFLILSPNVWAETRRSLAPNDIFKRYKDAVVRIEVLLHGASLGVGSGFFISKDGEIATSLHVVRPWIMHPETEVRIRTADGKVLRNVQVGNCGDSRGLDLCILKVPHKAKSVLEPFSIDLSPGESIVTIGHPRGLDFSISTGIISAVRENPAGWNEVQVDAAISPGNSGGPIINSFGQAVGVVYQFERDGQNLNFGITAEELINLIASKESNSRKTYRNIADARSQLAERGRRIARRTVEKIIRPTIHSMNLSSSSSQRPTGFKWMKAVLDDKSFLMLLPEILQSCERTDEGDGAGTTTCSSTGGDLILSIQRRSRNLEGSMADYRGRKLVNSRYLNVVDRLEAEGQWERTKLFEKAFLSRPSSAKCHALSKTSGQPGVISADESFRLQIRNQGFFQNATAVCRFETKNDSEPGAISFSQWIELGPEFYGMNLWLADPSRLHLAQSIADLVLVSAGLQSDEVLTQPYRITFRPGLKKIEVGPRGRWISGASLYDFLQDEHSSIAIVRSSPVTPSQMNRSFNQWAIAVAKGNDLRLVPGNSIAAHSGFEAAIEAGVSNVEIAGQTGRIGNWIATSMSDRSKSFIIHLAASFGSDSTWIIAEVTPVATKPQRSLASSSHFDIAKSLQTFRNWALEFEPLKNTGPKKYDPNEK